MVSSGYPTMYIDICQGRRAVGYGGKCSPLAGIEATPSTSKDLRLLLTRPPDFQTFLRSCMYIEPNFIARLPTHYILGKLHPAFNFLWYTNIERVVV